jgi:hypothetical protein
MRYEMTAVARMYWLIWRLDVVMGSVRMSTVKVAFVTQSQSPNRAAQVPSGHRKVQVMGGKDEAQASSMNWVKGRLMLRTFSKQADEQAVTITGERFWGTQVFPRELSMHPLRKRHVSTGLTKHSELLKNASMELTHEVGPDNPQSSATSATELR